MGALRTKMIEEMRLRNFSPRTEQSYVSADSFLPVAPSGAGPLTEFAQRGDLGDEVLLPSDFGLGRTEAVLAAKKRELAITGGVKPEGSRAFALCPRQASRPCLLMTAYATGVRVSELVRLKVSDIDSERMMVKVEQGKGKKDRYTILSERLLSELRTYWKEHRSPIWLFPNRKGGSISIDYAQRIYNWAKQKAQIHKGKGIHILRHCFATHLLLHDDISICA
jgi:integrase/recombinase XerD